MDFPDIPENLAAWSCSTRLTSFIDGAQQLDIVKFALPLVKISFHPIFQAVGKHTNFFMSNQAASRPFLIRSDGCDELDEVAVVLCWF